MVCPYCSADMEPIELNGKVFCSNCGLTVANNAPSADPTNVVNPEPTVVSEVTTDSPEEVEFPIIPEVKEAEDITIPDIPKIAEEPVSIPRKLEVITEDDSVEQIPAFESVAMNPITEEAVNDLGLTEKVEEPVFESKIADLTIPSEEDFSATAPENNVSAGSFIELENTGDEKTNLEASGILLDILGEESRITEPEPFVPTQDDRVLNPVSEPEIPEKTETDEKDDDIYTLPSEVKVGLTNKKVKKEVLDPKTEKKIEKIEEKLEAIPEPVVKITPEEAEQYDPDTISIADIDPNEHKGKVIKEYFSAAIERDKETKKTKKKKAAKKNKLKTFVWIFAGLGVFLALALGAYVTYYYFQPTTEIDQNQQSTNFDTQMPAEIPPGYVLSNSKFSNEEQSFNITYKFVNDDTKTITYKQIKTSESTKYISDYLLANNSVFTKKTVGEIAYTEANKNNLLWTTGNFVFVIESVNYELSNELLYKMAESVE